MNMNSVLRFEPKSLWRDPLLPWIFGAVMVMPWLLRFGFPVIDEALVEQLGFSLAQHSQLIASLLPLVNPLLVGTIFGLLLLDQKDEGSLSGIQVTPIGLTGYLKQKLAVPMILTAFFNLVGLPASGLADLTWHSWLLGSTATLTLAPLTALVMVVFAENKVQGLAITKAIGAILMLPLAAYFLPPIWQWGFAIFPTFLPTRLLWNPLDSIWLQLSCWLTAHFYIFALLAWLLNKLTKES